MRFKYVGQSGQKDLDLVLYKVLSPNALLIKGQIIDVPDSQTELIKRLKINGNFEEVQQIKIAPKKPKKEKKKEEKEDK